MTYLIYGYMWSCKMSPHNCSITSASICHNKNLLELFGEPRIRIREGRNLISASFNRFFFLSTMSFWSCLIANEKLINNTSQVLCMQQLHVVRLTTTIAMIATPTCWQMYLRGVVRVLDVYGSTKPKLICCCRSWANFRLLSWLIKPLFAPKKESHVSRKTLIKTLRAIPGIAIK